MSKEFPHSSDFPPSHYLRCTYFCHPLRRVLPIGGALFDSASWHKLFLEKVIE
jgi:hypothetical protein